MGHAESWQNWGMSPGGVRYREYAPCEALRGWVRALFSFVETTEEPSTRRVLLDVQFDRGERFCAPTFADAHSCIVFSFERRYCPDGIWRRNSPDAGGNVIGPRTFAGPPFVPERAESVGAYFGVGAVIPGASAIELENRAVAVEDLWGADARRLMDELSSLRGETARLDRLESALVERMSARRQRQTPVDLVGVAAWMVQNRGQLPIERIADEAGLSRRHFTRVFRENLGVGPKMFGELLRFRSALGCIACGEKIEWALAAVECGYTDQSHMIAEFRRFAGLTPASLIRGRWFHPFIEAQRARQRTRGVLSSR